MKKQIILASVLGALALPVMADNFYVFGDVGQGKTEIDGSDNYTFSKTATTYSLGAGYNVNRFFAVELAYRDLGETKDRGDAVDDFGDSFNFVDKYDVTALQASVVGKLPISDEFNLYGRVGVAKLNVDYKSAAYYSDGNNPAPSKDSYSKTKALAGVGASYDITPQFAIRAEYNQYAKWDDTKLSSLTVGATYSF